MVPSQIDRCIKSSSSFYFYFLALPSNIAQLAYLYKSIHHTGSCGPLFLARSLLSSPIPYLSFLGRGGLSGSAQRSASPGPSSRSPRP